MQRYVGVKALRQSTFSRLCHTSVVSYLPPLLAYSFPFPPLYFLIHRVLEECLQRVNSTQHGSSGDANHHQQQRQEMGKNYRMLLSKGATEIEYPTSPWRFRLDQHVKGTKPQLLGLCLWSKVTIILGRLTPISSLKTGSSLCVRRKNEILSKKAITQNTFTLQNHFPSQIPGLEVERLSHGVDMSVGRNLSSILLLLADLVLYFLKVFNRIVSLWF